MNLLTTFVSPRDDYSITLKWRDGRHHAEIECDAIGYTQLTDPVLKLQVTIDEHKLDPAGRVMPPATLLEQQAVRALNMVKAWRDSDGNVPFPHEARELIDAVLMTAEQRRTGLTP